MWPLEFIGLVPLWAALERLSYRSWRTALAVSWLYGTIAIAGGYHFMWAFTKTFSGFNALASGAIFLGFCLYLGFQFGLQGTLYWAIRRGGWTVAAAAVPTLLVTEWLYPKMFPVYLGNALIEVPLLVQTVDIAGPLAASLTVAVVNVAIFECVRAARAFRRWPVALVACAVLYLGGVVGYGAHRMATMDELAANAPSLNVGLVQANVSIAESKSEPRERRWRYVQQTRELERRTGPLDLIVWPEAVFYPWVARDFPGYGADIRAGVESPVLLGATTFVPGTRYEQKFNSALIVHEDEVFGETYDKNKLIMFGERLPFGRELPELYQLVPNSNRLTAGRDLMPLSFGEWRLSTPICYEDLLPDFVRRMVRTGLPHVLVNLTNDAWFGDSQGAWIHLRLAQLRAVEHRRYLLRAANTGITAIVDPSGRVVGQTDLNRREDLVGTVPMLTGLSLYARWGDWLGWTSLALTLCFVGRRHFER
jgi:apolipoprotein N-acyltransferase